MVQRGSDAEFPVGYEIIELAEPELLVLRSDPIPGMHGTVYTRVELEDLGGRTRMTLTDGPYPESAHAEAGWSAAFDKLAQRLASLERESVSSSPPAPRRRYSMASLGLRKCMLAL